MLQSLPIGQWEPHVGDIVMWHGWFKHWFGVVTGTAHVDGSTKVMMVKAGIPLLLARITPDHFLSEQFAIPLAKIQKGVAGEYAVARAVKESVMVWYV